MIDSGVRKFNGPNEPNSDHARGLVPSGPGPRGGTSTQGSDQLAYAGRGLAAAAHIELRQDPVDVVLDGGELDLEPARDLLVGEPTLDQVGDLALPRRQLGDVRLVLAPSREHRDPVQ